MTGWVVSRGNCGQDGITHQLRLGLAGRARHEARIGRDTFVKVPSARSGEDQIESDREWVT
jgi:hypothetical protein